MPEHQSIEGWVMKLNWESIKGMIRGTGAPDGGEGMDAEMLKEMARDLARGIATTRPDEIDCDECFEQIDQFVEMELAGKDAAEAMPLVQDHLDRCGNCREEFEALLAALKAVG